MEAKTAEVSAQQTDQLKLIYDYAKFHIGLYATVNTALVAVLSLADDAFKQRYRWLFIVIFLFFLAAGVGGGLVASHIVYSEWKPDKVSKLLKGFCQPTWSCPVRWTRFKWFIFLEHYAFWLGVAFGLAILAFVR